MKGSICIALHVDIPRELMTLLQIIIDCSNDRCISGTLHDIAFKSYMVAAKSMVVNSLLLKSALPDNLSHEEIVGSGVTDDRSSAYLGRSALFPR